ncbi:MAG TPA: hypothetical protein ENK99_06910, partial [Campylobacterales bacterium]|nr:hypothetical protein [Campylobacterales bacterium]
MTDSSRSKFAIDLLSLPYRDRQLIVIIQEAENTVERVDIRLRDYYHLRAKDLNPLSWLRKEYWTDTRNLGLIGYLIDKAKGGQTLNEKNIRYLRKLQADVAERLLKFPPGHPLYDTVYVGHPIEPPIYIPMAAFHRFLFEEKFNELLTLLWSLCARKVTINYLNGYSGAFNAEGKLSMPTDLPIDVKGSFQRKGSHRSEAILNVEFIPCGEP